MSEVRSQPDWRKDAAGRGSRPLPMPLAHLLERTAAPRYFSAGTVLGKQGDPCPVLHIAVEGRVLLTRRDEDGAEQALGLLGPGDAFGVGAFQAEPRWLVSARAVSSGRTYTLTRTQWLGLGTRSPEALAQLFELLSRRIEGAYVHRAIVLSGCPRERLLALLRGWSHRFGQMEADEVWLPLELTLTELGEIAGMARETVSRALATLQADGSIARRSRRGIWLSFAAAGLAAAHADQSPAPPHVPLG